MRPTTGTKLQFSPAEQRRIQKAARGDQWVFAEMMVQTHYGGMRPAKPRRKFYDVEDEDNSTLYQVKSTSTKIDGRIQGRVVDVEGRFRVWKSECLKMVKYAKRRDENTAWYVFVLLDKNDSPIGMRRVHAETLKRHVENELNGWDHSGHSAGMQQKVPATDVFDVEGLPK